MMLRRPNFPYRIHSTRNHRGHGGKPDVNRNIPSAVFGLLATGCFAVAMADPNWMRLDGGRCTGQYIGLYTIFGLYESMPECLKSSVIDLLRVCAVFSGAGIVTSMFQFALDLCNPKMSCLRYMRKNSIGNILSVLFSVSTNLTCYWVTVEVSKMPSHGTTKIRAYLDIGFYLVSIAGISALLASIFSLFQITCEKQPPRRLQTSDLQLQLMNSENISMEEFPSFSPPVYCP